MTHDELRQLLVAPEMVVVDLLGHCLDALRLAMLAEHPLVLDELAAPDDPPVQRRARVLLRQTAYLHRELEAYRREVRAVLEHVPRGDEIPF
jgi:hypothetical protein